MPVTTLNISSARSDESLRESVDPFPHVGEDRMSTTNLRQSGLELAFKMRPPYEILMVFI